MKTLIPFFLITLSSFAQLKPLDSNLINNIDKYRHAKLNKGNHLPASKEELKKAGDKLNKLPSPYQKLPYYIWGLFKKNKKLNLVSDEQLQQLEQLVQMHKDQRSRLHDERNYCRVRMLLSSYEYALAVEKDALLKRKQVELWLSQWLKFKSDEEDVAYRFIKGEWDIFNKEQKQKIINAEWKEVSKELKDYERKFAGDKLLTKAFKMKATELKVWNEELTSIQSQFSPIRQKYLNARNLYNKAFFYIDEVPESISLKLSEECNLHLKEIFLFQADAMRKLMSTVITDDNRKEYQNKLKDFIKKFYSTNLKKYYIDGNGKGLIDLVDGKL